MRQPLVIASLLPGATEVLFALGLGNRVVAVSHECDWPPEAAGLPKATRSRIDSSLDSGGIDEAVRDHLGSGDSLYDLDRDLLARLEPDLIITQDQCDVCAVRYEDVVSLVESEPALAGTQVLPLNPAGLGDVLEDIVRIGEAAGTQIEAARLYKALRKRVTGVWSTVEDIPLEQRPSALCIEWLQPLMTAGNWVPRLVELAGGRSLLATEGQHSSYVSWESIREASPDVIVVAPCGFDLARTVVEAELLRDLPGWQELPAVRDGRVWAVDGNSYFNRSGPRIVDSLEILAHVLHPDRFPPPEGAVLKRVP
jgi:iron complex transport system substrate-binding protein